MEVLTVCTASLLSIKIANTCGLVQEVEADLLAPSQTPRETVVYQDFHGSIFPTKRWFYWLFWLSSDSLATDQIFYVHV